MIALSPGPRHRSYSTNNLGRQRAHIGSLGRVYRHIVRPVLLACSDTREAAYSTGGTDSVHNVPSGDVGSVGFIHVVGLVGRRGMKVY